MKLLVSLAAVGVLFLLGLLGAAGTVPEAIFGVLVPYLALAVFLGGLTYRVLRWAAAPVPFRIPTTCGQQKSLPWIKQAKLDNPSGTLGVVGRMALEVVLLPFAAAQYEDETARGRQTGLRDQPGALAGGHGLPLVDAGDSAPAPAALRRTRCLAA